MGVFQIPRRSCALPAHGQGGFRWGEARKAISLGTLSWGCGIVAPHDRCCPVEA